MYETCIRILHVTLGKTEGKTSLNETNSWIQKGSETTCGMHGKKVSEMKKTTSNQLYPRKTMDRNKTVL
jgi:hypothetical protein